MSSVVYLVVALLGSVSVVDFLIFLILPLLTPLLCVGGCCFSLRPPRPLRLIAFAILNVKYQVLKDVSRLNAEC